MTTPRKQPDPAGRAAPVGSVGLKLPRKKLIKALAHCVESLVSGPLIESAGAIRSAMQCEEMWEYLSSETIETLGAGFGYFPPNDKDQPTAAS